MYYVVNLNANGRVEVGVVMVNPEETNTCPMLLSLGAMLVIIKGLLPWVAAVPPTPAKETDASVEYSI